MGGYILRFCHPLSAYNRRDAARSSGSSGCDFTAARCHERGTGGRCRRRSDRPASAASAPFGSSLGKTEAPARRLLHRLRRRLRLRLRCRLQRLSRLHQWLWCPRLRRLLALNIPHVVLPSKLSSSTDFLHLHTLNRHLCLSLYFFFK